MIFQEIRNALLALLLLLAAAPAGFCADKPARRTPNILLIMADQLAPQMTGPYGNREVKTPQLDRLAREGVVFTAAYTNSPLCVPARSCLLSGCYVSRIGTWDNGSPLSSEVPTVAHHLRLAGYETVLSGKMHFVGPDQLHGFERRLTTDIYPADFGWTPRWEGGETIKPRGGRNTKARLANDAGVEAMPPEMQYDDTAQAQALAYLSRRQAAGGDQAQRPFFLCVSFSDPHGPYKVTQELWDLYEGVPLTLPRVPVDMTPHQSLMDQWVNSFHGVTDGNMRDPQALYRLRRAYCAQVTYVDRKIGELLERLKTIGELDNTAIIFTADHGDMLAERLMVEKRTFYEYSARVPLLAWFPAQWRGGRACDAPVSLVDIFPTLTDLSTTTAPLAIDGRSFLNILDGRPDTGPARIAISEYHGEGVIAPCFMIREGDFKFIRITGGAPQLFNVKADPGEWKNLAGDPQYRELCERLHARLSREFDPAAIDKAVRLSQRQRTLIKSALSAGQPASWVYDPAVSTESVRPGGVTRPNPKGRKAGK